jgi:hypothetical protein
MKRVLLLLLCGSSALASPVINFDSDTLKFGYISAGGRHSNGLTVSNGGDQDLIISNVAISDIAFSLLEPSLPDTIPPGQSSYFGFRFSPQYDGDYSGQMLFNCNDPIRPDAPLAVSAHGTMVFAPGEIIWAYQGIENVVSCTAVDDIDGDNNPDVVAESFDSGAQGDNLYCISGSGQGTGLLIWSARPLGGPSNSGGYGDECLIPADDLNNNGTPDLVLGTAWGSRSVFGIEGTTGQTIWSYDTYQYTPSGWAYSVYQVDDMNGDSIPEILAGFGSDANAGVCLDGANGSVRWRRQVYDAVFSVCAIEDVSGDGVGDAILGAGDYDDLVYCVSGGGSDTSVMLWTYDTNGGSIHSVAPIKDINSDDYDDVIVGTWYNGHNVVALSGYSADRFGDLIWTTPIGQPIMRAVVTPDLNNDGYEDVVVASWASAAIALSGADGGELWRLAAGDDVWAIFWAYDVTGDSIAEIVAGSFTGETILINGNTGEQVWTCPSEAKIFTVRPIGDVNGDGKPDIIAGQQMLSSVGGRFFVISGGTVEPDNAFDNGPVIPQDHLLLSSYPNPFNARTRISYSLSTDSDVMVEAFNVLGQRVELILAGHQKAGTHSLIWDAGKSGAGFGSGAYFVKVTAGDQSSAIKVTVLK